MGRRKLRQAFSLSSETPELGHRRLGFTELRAQEAHPTLAPEKLLPLQASSGLHSRETRCFPVHWPFVSHRSSALLLTLLLGVVFVFRLFV